MYITDMGYCYPSSDKAKSMGRGDTGTWYCTGTDDVTTEDIPMDSPYEAIGYTFYHDHSTQALGSAIYWAHQKLTEKELLKALPWLGNVRIA